MLGQCSPITYTDNIPADMLANMYQNGKESLEKAIHKEIKSGSIKFADAAVKHSNCPSSQSGGSLGEFTKGMMVKAFEDVAFSLDIEQISEPFESEFGFHIVKRDN